MACRWIILICLSAQRIAEGSYENSIILTTVPTIPGFPNTRHIYLIPGTPYDLANNATLYGTYFHFTKTGQLNAKLRSCKVDYSRKILYLYDYSAARVEAIPYFDWQNEFASVTKIVRMHTGVSRGFVKLGVDWVSGNIYWTDPMFRWIAMQPGGTDMIDVGNYKVIVKEDLEKPYALAVDPVGGKLFWSDIAKYPKIEKASLTGENRETIISTGLKFPLSIDVDMSGTDRRIYWVDAARDTVESADLTGGERRIVVRIAHSEFYDVALFRDILSVIDVSRNKVFFINKLNGQHIANPYSRTSETIWGICMYDAETQPEMQDYCSTASCSDICVNEGGQATCLCREGFKLQTDLSSCTEDTSKYHRALVLCDGSSIYLADIRSLTAVLAVYNLKKTYASTVGDIKFITLDMVDRKVIFATTTDIYSIAIDMLNPTALHIVTSQNNITGLTMDWQDKNIYWTLGQSSGEIRVVSQEGGSIFRLQSGLNYPRGLKVLSLENKMVWISGTYFSNKIELSNIDGTERKTIVSSASLTDPKSLGFESHTNRLYWIDSGHIKRVYINGTGLEILAASTVSPKLFLTYQDYLVWTEDNTTTSSIILTADVRNPALTLIKDSFADVGAISAMAVLDESLQPLQKGPCEADNGECEHICIPIGKNRICKCEYGFTKDANGRTCSSIPFEDNFILVTDWTHNKIYQISLISDDVRAMDIDSTGNPNAVLYQPIEKRVIWADTKDKNIHSSYLNGSDHKVIINKGVVDSYADRLAVDSTSGNLYYTSVNATVAGGFKGVSVISPNGDSLDLVTGGYAPRDIAVDPAKGLMFWTDHGSVPTVKKANMDGTSVTVIVSANIKWPNGIAIDYQVQQLYLSDGYLDTIQKCTYSGFCSIIYTDAGAHLMDIELSEHYLYFTAWNKPYITKMNKNSPSDITRLAANAELGRLDSIYIYSSSAAKQPVNVDCAADQGLGDCSTLCLPTNNGRRCACSNNVDLWPNSNVCEDISKCGSHIQNGEIIGTCTNLHKTQCSYDCHRFYTPSTQDGKITCFYGLWSVTNPCSFSDVKCPQTVDKVVFDSACSYNNSDTCTYDCIPGYTPSSATKTMTCDKGIWDNQTPCDEIVPDCPSNVDKVSFPDTCYFQNNEQCTYTCLPGYRPTAEKLVCISKTWNLEEPCEAITCSETVDKVDFEPSCTFDDGVNCTYGCISGYTPTTSNRTLICDSGTWDNQHPCIKIDCPTDLEQVIFPGTCTFQNDEECAFSCAPGTRPTVTNSRMSCIGGSWNVLSPCRVPKCSTHIQNGEIVGTCTYLPETECSFKCDRFYRSSAQDSKITCFDGQWNMSNPCSFSDAECPRTFDKVLFHSACSYNNSETCTYDCIPGYTPSSAAKTMTCDKGIWDNQNPCDEIVPDCPTVVDKVMFPDSCYFQNGEECMYNCTSGFVPTAGSMVCSGSAWNTVEPCQALKCSQTDNAVIFESCSYESGDSCVYSCGVGFAPTSSDRTLTCVRGVWDNASPCVHTDCPTNIETVIFPGTCTFQNDEQCAYSCTAGTRPTVSDSRMTCIGGSWNIHSPCEDAKCIKAVDKVLFNSTCSFKYSETCTYSCIQGYTPSSSSGTLTCVDGEWDSQDPCDELVPDCPNDVDKVLFQGACYFQNNERCTYTCLDGYRPIAEEIVCIGRNWNLEKPCEDITCSETVDKVDFEPSCTFDVGESCKYGCVSGYTPTASDKTLTCDSGGAWGNQQPCVQIDCATDIDHVIFPGTCTFQNDEECAFSCAAGARPTITDSRMTCIGGSWNVHTPCEVPKCSNQIHNGEIIGACTYLHKTECSFKCDRFYRPTTQNSKITCVDGQWNMSNPCLFSDAVCPHTVDKVVFDSACTYNNSETCTYDCVHWYTPSSATKTLTCDNGIWETQKPCDEIVPDCPTVVDNVTFSDSCTFQSGEECIYNCTSGLALTAERLICSGSTWTPVEPCEDLKCSETVDEVIFESCNYENGERCKYKCEVNYTPTSTDRTLTCVSGAWDNSSPCVQIDCPTNIEKVIFPGTCTFQNDEQCAYSCETGTRPRVSDSRMTCIGGSWNIHNPCEDAKCPHTVDKVLFHSACNYNYGETCTYNCTQGYTPSSISGIMTCEDGVWDVQSPCNKMVPDCPTKVDKVSFPDTCYFQSNEQCTYTCLSGYRPKAETLLCMSNYWNLEEPCEEITCSEIVDKVNFDPSCNFDNGESCTYGCVSGYTPTASDRTLRCDSGTWDNQQPCVKIDCPKDIDHVEFPGTCTFQNDEECAFSCAAGARPTITDSRMTCIGGSWNVHAPCKVPKCSNQIQNGEIIGACTYLHETECSYVCDRFYRPSTQDRKITCFDGQWNRSNPCSFSDAKCPHTVDKVLFHSACSYNNSETCTYDCISGYTPSSVAKTMTCDSGIWDNQKPCDEIVPDCPTVVDKVSFPSTCNFQNGEECTYNCSSGFVPKAGNMVCNGSTWNIVEPCEDHKCTEIVDKVILESCSYESGESCVYSCVVGFTPTSNDRTLTCNLGAWDNTIPCVKIDCPTGIDKVIFPGTCTFQNDEQCAYSCAAGTRPTVSDSRMTCIGGSWNIHSPCEDAECTKKLDKVLFDPSCSYHYGETCIYGCIQGYTPSSSSGTITCDDGVWDNQSPCDEIVPDCPTHVDKVSFPDTCYHQNNEQCTYTCLSGYRPVAEKLVCIGQKWNIEQPCEDISCSETVDKVDFEPSCTYDDGESCKYECIPGFTPAAGDRTLICNGGTWNIGNPCLKIDCPTNIDYVKFPGTCTFQNDEECAYSCDVGARPTITDSRMTCIGGSWNVHIPCTAITTTQTTTSTTKPSATSSMSSSTQKEAATSAPQVGPSVVPISAGAGAGALVLLAVIIAAIIVVIRKRAKQPPLSQTVQDFESHCYQGFENYAEIADMPASSPASQQPDSIYDFIRFDELNARECESKDTDTQHGNVYATMAERGAGSGDYETLFHETSDYLKPANSNNPFADYLKPVNSNNAETGFI